MLYSIHKHCLKSWELGPNRGRQHEVHGSNTLLHQHCSCPHPCVWELLLEMLLWGNTLGEHKWPHTSWPEGPSRPPEVVSKRCLEKKCKARASPPPYLLNSLQHWASQARGCIFSLSSPSWYSLHEFVAFFNLFVLRFPQKRGEYTASECPHGPRVIS